MEYVRSWGTSEVLILILNTVLSSQKLNRISLKVRTSLECVCINLIKQENTFHWFLAALHLNPAVLQSGSNPSVFDPLNSAPPLCSSTVASGQSLGIGKSIHRV